MRLIHSLLLISLATAIMSGCSKTHSPSRDNWPKVKLTDLNGDKIYDGLTREDSSIFVDLDDEVADPAAKSCVSSICRNPVNLSVYSLGEEERAFVTDEDDKKVTTMHTQAEAYFLPKLNEIMDAGLSYEIKSRDFMERLFKKLSPGQKLQVSEFSKNFHHFQKALNTFTHYEDKDELAFESDTEAFHLTPEAASRLEADELELTKNQLLFFSTLINLQSETRYSTLEDYGLLIFLKVKYGRRADIEESAVEFKKSIAELKKKFESEPLFFSLFKKDYIIEKFLNNETLTFVEEKYLGESLGGFSLFSFLLDSSMPELMKINSESIDLNYQMVADHFTAYLEKKSDKNLQRKHARSKAITTEICLDALSLRLAAAPSDQELAVTEKVINDLRSHSKVASKKIFPTLIESEIAGVIDNIKFNLPKNYDQSLAEIDESFELYKQSSKNSQLENIMDENDPLGIENIFSLFYFFETNDESDEFENVYSDLTDLCLSYKPELLSDASVTVDNQILTSPLTVELGHRGAGVIAHEIGHRIQQEYPFESRDLRQCLLARHFSKDGESTIEDYYDEDFADLFSVEVLKLAQLKDASYNYACYFLTSISDTSESGEKTYSSPFVGMSVEHLLLPSEDSAHSPEVLRLLQIADDLDHRTPECDEYKSRELGKELITADNISRKTSITSSCSPQ